MSSPAGFFIQTRANADRWCGFLAAIVLIALFIPGVATAGVDQWTALGVGPTNGCDQTVQALAVYQGDLYAGGSFSSAGGVPASYVARWDGAGWSPVGGPIDGTNGTVLAMTVYDNLLIVGGDFTMAGGAPADHVAAWNGSAWMDLSWPHPGLDVHALTVHQGQLYAGGGDWTGGPVERLMMPGPPTWTNVGMMSNVVRALITYGNDLIAAGAFTGELSTGPPLMFVAGWNTGTWSPLGMGMNFDAYALEVFEGMLIAGGEFTLADGMPADHIAAWDGGGWWEVSGGIAGDAVYALDIFDDDLIAGGWFDESQGAPGNNIARLDDWSWGPMGAGMDHWVDALTVYGGLDISSDELIAGGNFDYADGNACNNVATWTAPPPGPGFDVCQDLPGIIEGDTQWGDLDGDGDLDLVYCGDTGSGYITHVYMNVSGTLTLHPTNALPGIRSVGSNCLDLGDYDNDGDLDLAMAGYTGTLRIAEIYENDGTGSLTLDTGSPLLGVVSASVAWGDVDGDGDLDLALMGSDGATRHTKLYLNHPTGTLTEDAGTTLTGLSSGEVNWGDYDGDGDLDLITCGTDDTTARQVIYCVNDPPGTLTEDGPHGLDVCTLADLASGDLDGDGDLDMALTGEGGTGGPRRSRVYENDGTGTFSLYVGLGGIYRSSCAWGDYDNDGDLDVIFAGYTGTSLYTQLYENTGTGFTATPFYFPGIREGSLSWADIDQDGDLDLFLTGADWSVKYARLYCNTIGTPNTPPSPPITFTSMGVSGGIQLSWSGASDTETVSNGLTYALEVTPDTGPGYVVSGTYDSPLMGNVDQVTQILIQTPPGDYSWRVRSIDAALEPSAWSASQSVSTGGFQTLWYFDDASPNGVWARGADTHWERMDAGPLADCPYIDLDHENPYYACSYPITDRYDGYRFFAKVYLGNNYEDQFNPVRAELRRGSWGNEGALISTASVEVTNQMGGTPTRGQPYLFDFGTIFGLELQNESLIVKLIYTGEPWTCHIFWDGPDCPSALHAAPPGSMGLDTVVCEPQGGANPSHPGTYWYDVTPGDFGRCDFHVRVSDPEPFNYGSPTLPAATWQFAVHTIAGEWWASWWDPDCLNAIFSTYRFQFENDSPWAWGDWRTTIGASSNPNLYVIDFSGHHQMATAGYGGLVHVPSTSPIDTPEGAPGVSRVDLEPNVPNPFNPKTTIAYSVPTEDWVSLAVFDAKGRLIKQLVAESRKAGRHAVSWDGADDAGRPAASGVYFYRLSTGGTVKTSRMVLAR